jgi:hypothetical protein
LFKSSAKIQDKPLSKAHCQFDGFLYREALNFELLLEIQEQSQEILRHCLAINEQT